MVINVGHYGRIGPGPGKYLLPPTVGYREHDGRKYRYPMYSMAPTLPFPGKPRSPGPKYQIEHMTEHGKASPPAYSLSSRHKPFSMKKMPGPAEYLPRRPPVQPCYSMSYRQPGPKPPNYPGPDKYMLPSTLGPRVPNKNSNAAYSMSYKHYMAAKPLSPGPAMYTGTDPSTYKTKLPIYSLSPQIDPVPCKSPTPGPKYYPKLWEKPGYSFGLRTDNFPFITADDEMPCA